MITYNYNQQKDYVKTSFSEKVNRGEVVNFIKSLTTDSTLPKNLRILISNQHGILKLKPADLRIILDENIKMFSHFNSLRVCIITKNPIDTALAVIYNHLIQLERYQFQVFNSEKAAISWLEVQQNENSHRIYSRASIIKATTL